jgi:archaea-specific RecJ-like exonuclease
MCLLNALILSHEEDADGICSAAIAKHWTGGEIRLTDYPHAVPNLREISKLGIKVLVITDLSVNDATFKEFISLLKAIKEKGTSILYIDHHKVTADQVQEIRSVVDVYKNSSFEGSEECASIQTYEYFKSVDYINKTSNDSPLVRRLACYGAVMDYLDNSAIAQPIIFSTDRPFILMEATTLGYVIQGCEYDEKMQGLVHNSLKLNVIQNLLEGNFPHEIPNASRYVESGLSDFVKLEKVLESAAVVKGNLAYFDCSQEGIKENLPANFLTPVAASALRFIFGVPVSMAFKKERVEVDGTVGEDIYKVSIRAVPNSKYDVATIIKNATSVVGGAGGGHSKAAGGSVPVANIDKFVELVAASVA